MFFWQGIPSPASGVWYLGSFPLRAYALAIIIGIVVAVLWGDRRWQKIGGKAGEISDVAVWAVPFGIVGGRIYHVVTDAQLYFGTGANPIDALKIWQGGLGIWGAIGFGALGAWIAAKRMGIGLAPLADAVAPGILLAQAIGRVGNYFNQELFGSPTNLPWGLEIDLAKRPAGYEGFETFHPTFLYESIWAIVVVAILLFVERKYKLNNGRVFLLYVALYSFGRLFIEQLRIDPVNEAGGFRLNTYTALIILVIAAIWFARRANQMDASPIKYRNDNEVK
ncbi:MAG: prolipoprotein diacylglyceryl transferase [Candidatus Nanopelagicales bacterium]